MSYIVPRDKPNRCTNCQFMDRITYDCMLMYENYYSDFESQYEHCPLVEIPIPHGRLIDVDEIEMPCLETTADQKWMEIAIKSTPTVIKAEKENI